MGKKKTTDKTKIHFLLAELNDVVEEDKRDNSLYVPNKKFYFNEEDELVKITDFTLGETYTD